ncbi:MBL fold metallo-hydrolase [Methylobacterium sp. Leaf100]|uniref:MBL fold metallo-hydrolase n=1 Tax=Methylobacterium sp. Leaf100 TaxID=1736252 RepID=UPI0009EC1FE6|nr:MBL fold metallo-hydrolase [Methylobacterium sp. Leaf100]USU34136.1 MBL fold metallo-hydrolase [Methylobacterium sp. OTU13CASTA1]
MTRSNGSHAQNGFTQPDDGLVRSDEGLSLRFWGVRGSTPVSGPDYVEFGGSTPCMEIRYGERLFLLDAGSGLNACGRHHRDGLSGDIDLLFSHLHLDHTAGLPFFKPVVLDAGRTINTWCGNLDGQSAAAALDRLFAPPLFPVSLDVLPCRFAHHGFRAGETLAFADGAQVDTILLNHPQGSVGYRFDHAGRRLCIISDIEHSDPWPDPALLEFVRGADLMVYDGMFTEGEYPVCRGWGHSTWQKGMELARAAGVEALAIIHLHPCHTDDTLRRMEAEMQAVMPTSFIARERQQIVLPPRLGRGAPIRPAPALAAVP